MSDNSTPSVRFDGFTNDWEQRRIQDFCKVTSGEFVIKTKQDDSYPYPVYNGGKTNTGYYSEYNQTGNKVIISARGAAGFVNRSATAFWAGNSCHSIEVLDESDWIFLYYALKVRENQLIRDQQTATIPSVSKKQVLETTVALPSVEEQKVISSFLGSIDSTLTLCRRKLDLLTQAKKALTQQIFSQKLRFKADDGSDFPKWEEKKLGDLCHITTGSRDANAATSDGPYKFFTCAREDYLIDDYSFNGLAILVAGNGDVGHTKIYEGKFDAYQRTYVLMNFSENPYYLKPAIDCYLPKRVYEGLNMGAMPYIRLDTLAGLNIPLPSSVEQQKIASCLSSADALIAQARVELEQWQEVKKSLLQQLFV